MSRGNGTDHLVPPDPLSGRSRGRTHDDEQHEAPFGACALCWPGGTFCGGCGHVMVDGRHGRMRYAYRPTGPLDRELVLTTAKPCDWSDDITGPKHDRKRCGCRRGAPLKTRIIDTTPEPLPRSSGRPTPRPFPQPSASGWGRMRKNG